MTININLIKNLYPNLSFVARIFFRLRFLIAPFEEIRVFLPNAGKILDIGCGHGILTNLIAFWRPKCQVTGIDIDVKRIEEAGKSVGKRNNIKFIQADLTKQSIPTASYQSIICFDILHHVPYDIQTDIIKKSSQILKPEGNFILKEIDSQPKWKYLWNFFHDKLMTKGNNLFFRPKSEWIDLLTANNLIIKKCLFINKGIFYPHVLIVATKK